MRISVRIRNKASQVLKPILRIYLFRSGLMARMAVLVFIGTLSLISLFAYFGTSALEGNTQRTLQERVVLAQVTASNIDYLLASVENVLSTEAGTLDPAGLESPGTAVQAAFRHLDFYASNALLLDRSGQVVGSFPEIGQAVSFENSAAVTSVLDGQPFAVSRSRRTVSSSTPMPIAVAPVRDQEGQPVGALLILINLSDPNLRTFSHPIGLGTTGYMDLIDSTGVILASTRPERVGEESDHGQTLTGLIRDRRQSVSACHDCHTSTERVKPSTEVLAFAPLSRAEWAVTVRQSEDEVFAETRLLQNRIFALMVVCLIGALFLVSLTTRSVISPVQALTAAAYRMASRDLTTPIRVHGHDEIAKLGQSFEIMRERLNASMAETQALNRDLDKRVQERTADLQKALAENARLYEELQHKEHLRRELLYRMISAQEDERKRISRELHDETCQLLTGLAYALDNVEADVPEPSHPAIERMRALTDNALDGVHRLISDLRPSLLDHLGLTSALRWYADQRLKGLGVQFTLREIGDARRLPPAIETALFRVAQEGINNIASHSHAQHALIVFEFADDSIRARIADDGCGFDVSGVVSSADGKRGLGLLSMEERMSAIGGDFRLQTAPGGGTVIRLFVPLETQL